MDRDASAPEDMLVGFESGLFALAIQNNVHILPISAELKEPA